MLYQYICFYKCDVITFILMYKHSKLFICNKVLFTVYTLKKVEAENAKNQTMLNTTQLFKTSAQKHGIYICYATHVCWSVKKYDQALKSQWNSLSFQFSFQLSMEYVFLITNLHLKCC